MRSEPYYENWTYTPYDNVTLHAVSKQGFEFVNWTGDIGGADAAQSTITVAMKPYFEQGKTRLEIVANFTASEGLYTVTLNSSPGGSVAVETPSGSFATDNDQPVISMQFPAGTELNLKAIAAEGYSFRGWEGDLSGVENASVVVESDIAISARFGKPTSLPWGWVAGGAVTTFGFVSVVIAKFTLFKRREGTEGPADGGSPIQLS